MLSLKTKNDIEKQRNSKMNKIRKENGKKEMKKKMEKKKY